MITTRKCVRGGGYHQRHYAHPWGDRDDWHCLVCGDTKREYEFHADYFYGIDAHTPRFSVQAPYSWDDAECEWCRGKRLREIAWKEQEPIRARLHADEQEVLSLYGRPKSPTWRGMFDYGTPELWKERYPKWQAERSRRAETARQRKSLRQGQQTLSAIRRHLRAPAQSPLPESRPAKTSPT